MEWIQATSRPCYHHRFPIRLVRRPSPSGTPTSLEQTSQPRTTLMNWRWVPFSGATSVLVTLRIIWHRSLLDIWHNGADGLPAYLTAQNFVEYSSQTRMLSK